MTDTTRSTRVRQHVRAPRAAVYRLLLDPAAIARWKVPDGMTAEVHTLEPIEGGAVRVSLTYREPTRDGKSSAHTDTYSGRFVRLVPDERVVEVDWFETDDPAMRGEMTSTIVLSDGPDGGTEVLGIHEGLPPGVTLTDNETGWRMALARLATLAEADSLPTLRTQSFDPNEPVLLRTYRYAYEAELARAMLEASGVACMISADSYSEAAGLPVRLFVRRDQIADAEAVLDAPPLDDAELEAAFGDATFDDATLDDAAFEDSEPDDDSAPR